MMADRRGREGLVFVQKRARGRGESRVRWPGLVGVGWDKREKERKAMVNWSVRKNKIGEDWAWLVSTLG